MPEGKRFGRAAVRGCRRELVACLSVCSSRAAFSEGRGGLQKKTERAGFAKNASRSSRHRLRRCRPRVRPAAAPPCGGFEFRPRAVDRFPAQGAGKRSTERAGFEPAVRFASHAALAKRYLQPLGHLSRCLLGQSLLPRSRRWILARAGCRRLDSNQRPRAYESLALPTELRRPGAAWYAGTRCGQCGLCRPPGLLGRGGGRRADPPGPEPRSRRSRRLVGSAR